MMKTHYNLLNIIFQILLLKQIYSFGSEIKVKNIIIIFFLKRDSKTYYFFFQQLELKKAQN